MFTKKASRKTVELEAAIDQAFVELRDIAICDPEYTTAADNLTKLLDLRSNEKKRIQVSPDVIVSAVTNLAGILVIVNYERAHVVTSKAIGLLSKLR